ncbi:unnamed protein product [Auanema sp. JU1783]|nr:unnamed protein product [Auanema sp. JU1783]
MMAVDQFSTLVTSSSVDRQRHRDLQRKRPSTLHLPKRMTPIPTVAIHKASASAVMCPVEIEHRRRAESSNIRNSEQSTLKVSLLNGNLFEHSRSTSPRPRTGRRDSMMSMLNRIWKSDECTRKPQMVKMDALDVPGQCLHRQISLSETNVTPRETASTSTASTSAYVVPRRPVFVSLTPKQIKLLKASFAQLNSGGTFLKIMEQVFRRLEMKSSDIRSIFLTTAFVNSLSRERSSPPIVKTEHDHCKCLVDLFDKIINCVDNMDSQLPMLRLYGEKHAQMRESGFTGAMIENFGEIAVSVIGSQESVKYNQDTMKAWRILLAYITDEMKVGFDRYSKISERRNSIQH